jgi:hypothetical protein
VIVSQLQQKDFADLTKEFGRDLETMFMVYQEHIVITMNDAVENEWSIDQLENELGRTEMTFEDRDKESLEEVHRKISLSRIEGPNKLKLRMSKLSKKTGWTGGKLQNLMSSVVEFNTDKIINKTKRIAVKDMKEVAEGLTTRLKAIEIPNVEEIFPARSVFIRKSAEKGKLLVDNLRDDLSKDLRSAMRSNNMMYAPGTNTQKVTKTLVNDVENRITKTFQGYTKKNPKFGIPTNVHAIAVTEVRSSVAAIKKEYITKLVAVNDLVSTKIWKHNPQLSRTIPRPEHAALNGIVKDIDGTYTIKSETGNYTVHGPHDGSLPVSQVISCHCDLVYRVRKKRDGED